MSQVRRHRGMRCCEAALWEALSRGLPHRRMRAERRIHYLRWSAHRRIPSRGRTSPGGALIPPPPPREQRSGPRAAQLTKSTAAKALQPKFSSFTKNISAQLGVVVPHVEMKHVNAATIGLKGAGGLLFILSSLFGAYLLSLYLAFITPVVYDFYNYDMEKAAFVQLFIKFTEGSVVHTGILAFSLFEFLF